MKTKIKNAIYAVASGALLVPVTVWAQGYKSPTDPRGTFSGTVGDAVRVVLQYVLAALATVAIVGIVVGGVWYILSAGDTERTKTAKNIILYSIIGLVVALLGYAIVRTVSAILTGAGSSVF